MDEESLETLREQIIQQLLSLDVNAASGSDDDGYNDYYGEDTEQEWYQPQDDQDDQDDQNDQDDQDDGLEWYQPVAFPDDDNEDVPHDGDEYQLSEGATEYPLEDQPAEQETKKKKKKKKKKKNMPLADDDQVDAQVSDLQVLGELYDPSTDVEYRFRLAMDMFRKERKFTPMSNQILETYFTYGNMDEHKEVKAPGKRTAGIEINLEADILFVVASFLSSYMFTTLLWYDKTYFEMAPKVIIAFLRYILVRHAVPEYEDDVRKAIEISDRAKTELPKCFAFNKLMPEDVNQTCSVLFVKEYDLHDMPENSLEIMEQVVGVKSAAKVQLKNERSIYARVLRVESAAVDVEAGTETEAATTADPSPDAPADGTTDDDLSETYKPAVTLKVDLEEIEMSAVDGTLVPVAGKEKFSIRLTSEAAALLQEETVMWGKFYTLSNGVSFARPLNAFPSFYVDKDEEI